MAVEEIAAAKKRLGRRIIQAREHAGLNQRQLAERLVEKLSKSDRGSGEFQRDVVSMQRNLRRYENGHNVPRGDLLMLIAAETETDAAHFTSENGNGEDDDESSSLRRIAAELVLRGEDEMASELLQVVRTIRFREQVAP